MPVLEIIQDFKYNYRIKNSYCVHTRCISLQDERLFQKAAAMLKSMRLKKKKKKGGTKQSSNAELCLEELREFVHI